MLALDVGSKRIGVAGSDALGLTAQAIETLRRARLEDHQGRPQRAHRGQRAPQGP